MKYFAHPVTNCLLVLTLACCGTVWAEPAEIEAGVEYQGGTRLTSSEIGLEFTVPQGWQALLPIGGSLMHMEPDNADAQLLVSAVSSSNETRLIRLLSRSQPLDVSGRLIADGAAEKQGALYHQRYMVRGLNTKNLTAEAYAVLGDNNAAFIAVGVETDDEPGAITLAKQLVSSVSFKPPKKARVSDDGCSANIDWERQLGGRMLLYAHTKGGKSINRKLELCANHSFRFREGETHLGSDEHTGFRATMHQRKNGRWQIRRDQLMLSWSDGKHSTHTLSRRSDETRDEAGILLDDETWLVPANRACN